MYTWSLSGLRTSTGTAQGNEETRLGLHRQEGPGMASWRRQGADPSMAASLFFYPSHLALFVIIYLCVS